MADGVIANLRAVVDVFVDGRKALADIQRIKEAMRAIREGRDFANSPAGAMSSLGMLPAVEGLRATPRRQVEATQQLEAASIQYKRLLDAVGPTGRNLLEVQNAAVGLSEFFAKTASLVGRSRVKSADADKLVSGLKAFEEQIAGYVQQAEYIKRWRAGQLQLAPSLAVGVQRSQASERAQTEIDARERLRAAETLTSLREKQAREAAKAASAERELAAAERVAAQAALEAHRAEEARMRLLAAREAQMRRIGDALRATFSTRNDDARVAGGGVGTNLAMDALAVKAQQAAKDALRGAGEAAQTAKERFLEMVRVRGLDVAAAKAQAQATQAAAQAQAMAGAAAAATAQHLSTLAARMQGVGQLSQAAFGPLAGWLNRIGTWGMMLQQLGAGGGGGGGGGGIFAGFGMSAAGATAAVSGLALAFMRFHGEAMRVAKELEPIEKALELVKGKGEQSGEAMKLLIDSSLKYGLSMKELARPFMGLKVSMEGTTMAGEKFKEFFRDFSTISGNLALAPSQIAGAAKAFEQMFSKGTVQAEEFRHQLGDRWPAAMRAGMLAFQEMMKGTEKLNAGLDGVREGLKRAGREANMYDFMQVMKDRLVESTLFLPKFMEKYREMLGLVGGKENEKVINVHASLNRLQTAWDMFIRNLDKAVGWTRLVSSGLDLVSGGLSTLGQSLDGSTGRALKWVAAAGLLAASIATIRWGIAIGGALGLGTALGGTLLAATSALVARMGMLGVAIAAVGGVMYALSDPVKAATTGLDTLERRYADVQSRMSTPGKIVGDAVLGGLSTDISAKVAQMEAAKVALEESFRVKTSASEAELASAVDNATRIRNTRAREANLQYQEQIRESIRTTKVEYEKQIGDIEAQQKRLVDMSETVAKKQAEQAKAVAEAAEAARKFDEGAEKVRDVDKEIAQLSAVLRTYKEQGYEAAKSQQALFREMATITAIASATGQSLESVKDKFRALIALREEVQKTVIPDDKLKAREDRERRQREKDDDIIRHAETVMEGRGREADATKKLDQSVRQYEEALKRVGATEDYIVANTSAYRQALIDRANGIDYSARKFDLLPMMQRHLESTADKFADLMVKGKMTAQTVKEVFKEMALSVIKDLIAMSLKISVVLPMMQAMSNAAGAGGANLATMGSSLFNSGGGSAASIGSWATTVTASGGAFAKGGLFDGEGGVVDAPTPFMTKRGPALMGEAGAEAVVPLVRGPGGALGVQSVGGGGTAPAQNVTVNYNIDARGAVEGTADQIAKAMRKYDEALPGRLQDINKRM